MAGCGNNEYSKFVGKFDQTYFEIAKAVDIEDTLKTLKNRQAETNVKRIDKLKD